MNSGRNQIDREAARSRIAIAIAVVAGVIAAAIASASDAAVPAATEATAAAASAASQPTSAASNARPLAPDATHPASWEFSPYRVVAYVEFDAAPQWTADARAALLTDIEGRAHSLVGGLWQLKATEATAELHWNSAADIARVTTDSIGSEDLNADKLMLVGIGPSVEGRRECHIREFDVRTGIWGPVFVSNQPEGGSLADAIAGALWTALRPLVRIDDMLEPGVVVARVRGGELPIATAGLSLIRERMAFRPLIRHFDAQGRTLKNGVFEIDWTWFFVDSADGAAARCRLATAIQDPLDLKFDGRTEYLGLAAIAPSGSSTELIVQSRDNQRPLEDVEVLVGRLGERSPRLIGRTDSRGAMKLGASGDLAIVFLRSGDDLLARFPLVPGLEPSVTAKVEDNGRRLESGQLVQRLSEELIDLVAQQTVLKARFQRQVVRGDAKTAEKTLAAIKSLKTREAFLNSIDDRRESLNDVVSDTLAVAWLDKKLDETRSLATKHLWDAKGVAKLEAALSDR